MKVKILAIAVLLTSVAHGQQLKTQIDSVSYAIGVMFAQNLKTQGVEGVNNDLILKGLIDVMQNKNPDLSPQDAGKIYSSYTTSLRAKAGEKNKAIGEKYLAENGKRKEVTTTASGLQYEVIKQGSGVAPKVTDKVTVHYHGTNIDGSVFDSSVEKGQPLTYPVNGFVQGWQEALQLMQPGAKYKLVVPYNLAYGERGSGAKIKAFSTLIFELELISVEPAAAGK